LVDLTIREKSCLSFHKICWNGYSSKTA